MPQKPASPKPEAPQAPAAEVKEEKSPEEIQKEEERRRQREERVGLRQACVVDVEKMVSSIFLRISPFLYFLHLHTMA